MTDSLGHRHHQVIKNQYGRLPCRLLPVIRRLNIRHAQGELVEHRQNILRYARLFPPGHESESAVSLGILFKNKEWRDPHTIDGAGE